jgi:HEAT repeat protein
MLDSPNEVEVLRAAGALGAIGEKASAGAAPVDSALKALGRLARSAPQPAVREAACLALARIAQPSVEEVLVAALDDQTASVRFSAAQGLGNLPKVGERTVTALLARLQDENKGVRQAVAAALAKLGGPDAARKIADRLKAGAEAEPAVRNALWASVKTLVDHSGSADLAQELGDRFFAREGAEEMQHAAAMYEAALAKLQPAARSGPAGQALYEKLVDASIASGTPDAAVPALRQLLAVTPLANPARVRELNQQLARIMLAKEPGGEAMTHLAAAMKGASPEDRLALVKAVQARAETLLKADKPDQAAEVLDSFGRAVPDMGGTDLTDALKQLRDRAAEATIAQAITKLSGTDEQAAAATATLKKIGRPAIPKLLDALESAAKDGRAPVEAKVLAAIEAVTGSKDTGYNLQAPLEERLRNIAGLRQAP